MNNIMKIQKSQDKEPVSITTPHEMGYRGEIKAVFNMTVHGCTPYGYGDRAAQIIIMPYPEVEFEEVEELSETERGSGGFGSSGK